MPILKYGCQWPDGTSEFHIELVAFRDGTAQYGGDPDDRPFHFKNIVKVLWGAKSKKVYQWDPWTDRMLIAACEQKYLWLSGCAGCVAGETRIPNPVTGENPTVQELYDSNSGTTVMTLYGPAKATSPFVKGFEELYEITLGSGDKFTCSGKHRVLSEKGYVYGHELSVGQVLFGYERGLPGSTLDTGLSVRGEGARSSQKKAVGFQGGCPDGFYYDGGQLLEARESDQSSSPSPAGVPQCNSYASGNLGALENGFLHTHLHQLCAPPSMNRFWGRNSWLQTYRSLQPFSERLKHGEDLFLSASRFGQDSSQFGKVQLFHGGGGSRRYSEKPSQFGELEPQAAEASPERSKSEYQACRKLGGCFSGDEKHQQSPDHGGERFPLSYRYRVTRTTVASIRKTTKQIFYDLSVPGPEHYFAEGAIHHNSRKSTFGAVWALVNWLCSPTNTLILIASTSLTEARRRIWGQVEEYFTAGCESMNALQKGASLPGRIVSSVGKIRTEDGGQKFSDLCGIQLIAGDASHEKESLKKIGFHNKRVIMILDELTDLSPTLVNAARANLTVNPFFQLLGFGNFASIYDPLGINAEPTGGWGSVTDEFDQWETKDGLCLRFDGTKSPNVLAGHMKYLGQYGPEDLENHRKSLGENSASFWRMSRSFPCPEADANRIYSEADLIKGAVRDLVKWQSIPIKCASLDPAFATGGDKAMAYFGSLATSIDGIQTLLVVERKELREDIRKKGENKALQIAKLFRDECERRGIDSKNAGYDASGGGIVMDGLFFEIWKDNKLLPVQFGGAASERPASIKDPRPAKQVFQNRVSEIWFAGVDFAQAGQLKGLPAECCAELVERRKHKQGNIVAHNRVESKDEMKKRTGGRSPDDADAFLILLEVARVRLGFKAVGFEGGRAAVNISWKQKVLRANAVYKNVAYEPEQVAA